MQTLLPSAVITALLTLSAGVHAETASDFLARYEAEARQSSPQFAASADRGQQFFRTIHGNEWSCSSCHTRNPAAQGRHASTGKSIEPLAPASNPKRFTSDRKVEKWFRRNCGDVLGRACSAAEKADVLAYLMNAK